MKIINRTITAGFLLAAFGTIGCQNAANTNTTANKTANANTANANASNSTNSSADKGSTAYSQATPTDAYKTAWTVRDKKDVAGMKKVMSKDILDFLTQVGKDDNKSLDDQIKAIFERPQAKTAEARNEKITGDTATVEYLTETGEWKTMDFVKEDGVWKMTLGKTDQLNKKINESTNPPK